MLQNIRGMYVNAKRERGDIRTGECTVCKRYTVHVLALAASAVLVGTIQFCWQTGTGDPIKPATGSAVVITGFCCQALLAIAAGLRGSGMAPEFASV